MDKNEQLVQQVYQAKGDMRAADEFISSYMPFIKAQTAKFLKRPPKEGQDDELSIAMIAFHEAINGYSKTRGAFFSYASIVIKNRLIDYWRSNKKHRGHVSIEENTFEDEEGMTISDTLTDGEDPNENNVISLATREEIEELSKQMADFGLSLTDVAENSPKQNRTLNACRQVLNTAKADSELMDYFLRTGRLPIKKLTERTKVEKKTIERHRKYLAALLLVYSNGYELIRGHLTHLTEGENK